MGNLALGNAIAGFVANDNLIQGSVVVMSDNVAMHPSLDLLEVGAAPLGWGFEVLTTSDVVPEQVPIFSGNIMAHGAVGAWKPEGMGDGYEGILTPDNIIYAWGEEPSDPGPFVDPDRTIASYQEQLGASDTSLEAFMKEARKMRKGFWKPEYTAQVIVKYFQDGFAPPN